MSPVRENQNRSQTITTVSEVMIQFLNIQNVKDTLVIKITVTEQLTIMHTVYLLLFCCIGFIFIKHFELHALYTFYSLIIIIIIIIIYVWHFYIMHFCINFSDFSCAKFYKQKCNTLGCLFFASTGILHTVYYITTYEHSAYQSTFGYG